jgi:hypothetical protein
MRILMPLLWKGLRLQLRPDQSQWLYGVPAEISSGSFPSRQGARVHGTREEPAGTDYRSKPKAWGLPTQLIPEQLRRNAHGLMMVAVGPDRREYYEPLANLSLWPKGCHSGQTRRKPGADPESRVIKHFWIPAFSVMAAWGTLARASSVKNSHDHFSME